MSKDTFHIINRITILLSVLLAFIIPFANFSTFIYQDNNIELTETIYKLEQVVINPNHNHDTFNWNTLIYIVIISGIAVFFLKTLISIIQVLIKIHKGKVLDLDNDIKIIFDDNLKSPFSWIKYIFISNNDYQKNKSDILVHELAHIKKHHSIDLIFMNILCCIQWYNPIIWMFKTLLCEIHEYQADDEVLKTGINTKQYKILLIEKATGGKWCSVANGLKNNNLKNRFKMMSCKKSSKLARVKVFFPIIVASIFVVAFSNCNSDLELNSETTSSENNIVEKCKVTENNSKNDYEPFVICEEMPVFPDGEEALFKWMQDNIVYPQEAKDKKQTGKCFVKFIIDENGKVIEPTIIKSSGFELLDKSAIDCVLKMPTWKPGKQSGKVVRVTMQIPFNFQLTD